MVLEFLYCCLYEISLAKLLITTQHWYKCILRILFVSFVNFIFTFLIGNVLGLYLTYDVPLLNILLTVILLMVETLIYSEKSNKIYNAFHVMNFYCIYGFVSLCMRSIMIYIFSVSEHYLYMQGITRFISVICILVISYMLTYYISKLIRIDQLVIPSNYIQIYFGIWVIIICIVVLLSHSIVYKPSLNIYLIFILVIMLYITCFLVFVRLNHIYAQKEYERLQKEMNTLIIQNIEQEIQNNKDIRKFKHDIQNKLRALDYLDRQNGHKLYNELKEEFSQFENIVNTGNVYIDAIINSKYIMYKNQIDFQWKIIACQNIKMKVSDLCSILYNVLDNAVEETLKIHQNKIKVFIKLTEDEFIIDVVNITDKTKQMDYLQTTKDQSEHGLGLLILKRTIQKYNGIYKIDIKDYQFRTYVYISFD